MARVFLLCLLLLPVSLRADAIDEIVGAGMKKTGIPGLALGIVRDGRLVRARGYGVASLELPVPVTADTVFQGGSIGKMFTASAILLLEKEGKLSLSDPVSKHLPEAPESWKGITLRHLLHHTSGIPGFPYDDKAKLDLQRNDGEEEIIALAASTPLDFPPGTRHQYSNTGYVLLGIVIHRVTGKPYEAFLQSRVFQPLGMTRSRGIDDRTIIPGRAAGYEAGPDGGPRNQEWVAPSYNSTADGSLYFTVNDFAKWDIALGCGPVSGEMFAEMLKPAVLNDGSTAPYGLGWDLDWETGEKTIGHSGGWQGFSSLYLRFPERKTSVILLCNLASGDLAEIMKPLVRELFR
ncbi:MAG: serine hydrolase domain-containing protein [Luteolibacter sp.]